MDGFSSLGCRQWSKAPDSQLFKGWIAIAIGHFGKYRNTLCLSPQITQKHCFCFLLGPLLFPRETGSNAWAKIGGGGGQTMSIMVFWGVAYWINHYLLDNSVDFDNSYLQASDLSVG